MSWRLAWAVTVLVPATLSAAQVVVMDIKAVGAVPPALAAGLTPLMVAELGRHDGVSVVSQDELRALLEHEGNRQSLGCDDTACMTALAGALGSELLVVATLSHIDDEWICGMTLIRPDQASVIGRATARQRGDNRAASRVVEQAVHELFRAGLPAELKGPASMTNRAYRAVLLNFESLVLDADKDPREVRRRLVLDLVNTELDYDTEPKMRQLQQAAEQSIHTIDRDVLLAKDAADRERFLRARGFWGALLQDLQRVKEIRQKARERGMLPSSQPLRFLDPDPYDWPDEADIALYEAQWRRAKPVVEQLLRATANRSFETFAKVWLEDRNARSLFDRTIEEVERYGYTFEVLPLHAMVPWDLKRAIEQLRDEREVTFRLRQFKKGVLVGDDHIYLKEQGGDWKVRSW